MKETIKNFIAMVIASAMWVLTLLLIVSVYYLFDSGPAFEEWVLLGIVILLFSGGIFLIKKSQRIRTALDFPLIPWI